jgi:hypothetical protein
MWFREWKKIEELEVMYFRDRRKRGGCGVILIGGKGGSNGGMEGGSKWGGGSIDRIFGNK